MKYQIRENFLDKHQFSRIKNLITHQDFSWFKREKQVSTNKKTDLGYFTHSFFSKNSIKSNYHDSHIVPILNQLNAGKNIQSSDGAKFVSQLLPIFGLSDWWFQGSLVVF